MADKKNPLTACYEMACQHAEDLLRTGTELVGNVSNGMLSELQPRVTAGMQKSTERGMNA